MIDTKLRKTTGFTLVELMVVIGIMAVLMAIIIPATQSLRRGNRVSTCAFKLQQISNAMKAYHFDWGSVPPRYPGYPLAFDPAEPVAGPGLMALWEGGYLINRRALHCPSDKDYTDPNNADPAQGYGYYGSYMRQDDDPDLAHPYFAFNNYKYVSTRGVTTDPFAPYFNPALIPYYKQQLEDPLFYETLPVDRQNWYPDDRTVVAWCNFHTKEYFRDGEGQYQVLFWDGSTKTLPWWLFDGPQPEDPIPGLAPDAAWKMTPDILE